MGVMRSTPHGAVARDAKAAKLAEAILAAVPDLAPADVARVCASSAVRRDAERAADVRPGSAQTWGLVAGKLTDRLAGSAK